MDPQEAGLRLELQHLHVKQLLVRAEIEGVSQETVRAIMGAAADGGAQTPKAALIDLIVAAESRRRPKLQLPTHSGVDCATRYVDSRLVLRIIMNVSVSVFKTSALQLRWLIYKRPKASVFLVAAINATFPCRSTS